MKWDKGLVFEQWLTLPPKLSIRKRASVLGVPHGTLHEFEKQWLAESNMKYDSIRGVVFLTTGRVLTDNEAHLPVIRDAFGGRFKHSQ